MPRPRKVGTPEDMKRNVEKYINDMLGQDELPSFAGMLKYLGISKRTYHRLMNVEENDDSMTEEERHAYRKIFEDAQLTREDYLERKMVRDPRTANGCMNSLKQPMNGGFKDRFEGEIDTKITVNFTGVGGADAFK